MKTTIFLFISLATFNLFGQDTLTTEEFNNRGEDLNGKFIVLGFQSKSTINDGADTTIKISPITYYRIGELKQGKQQGVWESYEIGNGSDTLFWRSVYQNDTLISSAQYYSNGNMKSRKKYIDGRLVSSEIFLTNGRKYIEQQFTDCKKEYSDFEAVEIGYYGNGKLKYVGKMKCINRKVTYYDNWYYYSDQGELFKILKHFDNQPPEIELYKIKGNYYEWYDEIEK